MNYRRVVDLSHVLRPGREARRLEIDMVEATDITASDAEPEWYVMHWIGMDNHLGTHVEVPYHAFEDGADLAEVGVDQLVGEAVILDLRGHGANQTITLEEVKRAAGAAGGVGEGDIVLCMTGWSEHYDTDRYAEPPFLSREAVHWLVDRDIKVLGIDTRGSMDPAFPDRENHLPLFEAGVVYIENLTNLAELPEPRTVVAALPPAIEGLEGFPVRVVALI